MHYGLPASLLCQAPAERLELGLNTVELAVHDGFGELRCSGMRLVDFLVALHHRDWLVPKREMIV